MAEVATKRRLKRDQAGEIIGVAGAFVQRVPRLGERCFSAGEVGGESLGVPEDT